MPAMKVTPQLIRFIRAQMQSCALDTKARLARASGISEPTIGRILSGKRETISDASADKFCKTFGVSMEELLMIAMGHKKPSDRVMEEQAPYITRPPRFRRLCDWLEREAPEETVAAIEAVAIAGGFKKTETNNSRSGAEESPSVAKVA